MENLTMEKLILTKMDKVQYNEHLRLKYHKTDVCIFQGKIKLFRIQAQKDFGDIKAGDFGGYIEKESNLSHEGDCWTSGNAKVFGNAKIGDDAYISGNAKVYNNAKVYGSARVCDNAKVFGDACIYDAAKIYQNSMIFDNAQVCGVSKVSGRTRVFDFAKLHNTDISSGNVSSK